jgi:hypothetical protein
VRLELVRALDRLGARRRLADDVDAVAVEQQAKDTQEAPVVIDDETPKAHGLISVPHAGPTANEASM